MIVYATCNVVKGLLTVETKRVKIEKNNKAYIANEVYGANEKNDNDL